MVPVYQYHLINLLVYQYPLNDLFKNTVYPLTKNPVLFNWQEARNLVTKASVQSKKILEENMEKVHKVNIMYVMHRK